MKSAALLLTRQALRVPPTTKTPALQVGSRPFSAVISPKHLDVKQSLVNLEVARRLNSGSIWVQSEVSRFFRSLRA